VPPLSLGLKRQNLEKKNLEILSTTDGKKKLEIVPRNLEFSEVFPDEQSRDLRFSKKHMTGLRGKRTDRVRRSLNNKE